MQRNYKLELIKVKLSATKGPIETLVKLHHRYRRDRVKGKFGGCGMELKMFSLKFWKVIANMFLIIRRYFLDNKESLSVDSSKMFRKISDSSSILEVLSFL